jgi:hypothetical protein
MAATTSFRSDSPVRVRGERCGRDAEGTVRNGKKGGRRDGCAQSPRPERVQLPAPERL